MVVDFGWWNWMSIVEYWMSTEWEYGCCSSECCRTDDIGGTYLLVYSIRWRALAHWQTLYGKGTPWYGFCCPIKWAQVGEPLAMQQQSHLLGPKVRPCMKDQFSRVARFFTYICFLSLLLLWQNAHPIAWLKFHILVILISASPIWPANHWNKLLQQWQSTWQVWYPRRSPTVMLIKTAPRSVSMMPSASYFESCKSPSPSGLSFLHLACWMKSSGMLW